jgi:hypothetical protein
VIVVKQRRLIQELQEQLESKERAIAEYKAITSANAKLLAQMRQTEQQLHRQVCMHVCVCIYIYVCVCAWGRACIYESVDIGMYMYTHGMHPYTQVQEIESSRKDDVALRTEIQKLTKQSDKEALHRCVCICAQCVTRRCR